MPLLQHLVRHLVARAAWCAALCCAADVMCPAGLLLLQLWDRDGKHIKTMASLPLAEDIPIAFNSCRTGGEEFRQAGRS